MQDFYRFAFLPDGYPGRQEPDGSVFAHPIYGTYVLIDYLRQYERKSQHDVLDAIEKVANAAISRMSDLKGALVFWYSANPTLGARLYADHYSGLTQSYYAVQLARAGRALESDEIINAAHRVFRSLLIPVAEGGVLHETSVGPVIAEVPQQPNSWILNGWLSALDSVHRYASITDSTEAEDLLRRSTRALAAVLPLYDDPVHRISRYGLTGFTHLRITFATQPRSIDRVTLGVPGEPRIPVPVGTGTRWQPRVLEQDFVGGEPTSRRVRINAVLSLADGGASNDIDFRVTVDEPGTALVEAMVGDYSPLSSAPVDGRWQAIASLRVPANTSTQRVRIPSDVVKAAVYPTNFVKRIDGQNVNVYHTVHINRLRTLSRATGVRELETWADRWHNYIRDWAQMPRYAGLAYRDPDTAGVLPVTRTVSDE